MPKVEITQKDFDEIYEIKEITGEKLDTKSDKSADTTPEFLTKEEQDIDDKLFEDLPTIEENEDAS